MKAVIMTVDENNKIFKFTRANFIKNGFDPITFIGKLESDKKLKSKIVMSNWDYYFKNEGDHVIPPIVISEDDISFEFIPNDLYDLPLKFPNKIIWLLYQKTYKKNKKDIPVGAQLIYIPTIDLLNRFKKDLDSSRKIHFDSWLYKLNYVVRPYPPKTKGREITRYSNILNKIRRGVALEEEIRRKNIR